MPLSAAGGSGNQHPRPRHAGTDGRLAMKVPAARFSVCGSQCLIAFFRGVVVAGNRNRRTGVRSHSQSGANSNRDTRGNQCKFLTQESFLPIHEPPVGLMYQRMAPAPPVHTGDTTLRRRSPSRTGPCIPELRGIRPCRFGGRSGSTGPPGSERSVCVRMLRMTRPGRAG